MRNAMLLAVGAVFAMTTAAPADVLFQEGFESYAPGATDLAPTWTVADSAVAMDHQVVNDPSGAASGDQYWRWSYPHSQGSLTNNYKPTSFIDVNDFRQTDDPGVYTISTRLYHANNIVDSTSGQLRPMFYLWAKDSGDNPGVFFGVRSTIRYNDGRDVYYNDGGTANVVGTAWEPDDWMTVSITLDEINRKWSFDLSLEDGTSVASASDIAVQSSAFSRFDFLRLYLGAGHYNDGLNTRIDDVMIQGPAGDPIPEPATMTLLGLGGLALARRRRR